MTVSCLSFWADTTLERMLGMKDILGVIIQRTRNVVHIQPSAQNALVSIDHRKIPRVDCARLSDGVDRGVTHRL